MMKIEMPKLAYATTALEPVISEQTINFHYGKHLQNYVNTLSSLVKDTEWDSKSVEEIVKGAPEGPIFNNAGQVLNHALYFEQFRAPRHNNLPEGRILNAINDAFGNFDNFKAQFTQAATTLFGSGWAWLSQQADGKLVITKEANGSNPLRHGLTPLYGLDVWEHAYYLDFQNRRADHVAASWDIVDWEKVEERLK
ncbi:superoxide dismutase [Segatella oris]|uniref:Superoxide dismutase n=1 Tax=Segatella oris TaxID=28135 RepID=A0A3S4TDD4_9BACT|nr:superoxide dismutase [Segatella oris]VEH14522.1 Superoxide dismutase [Mn/Fe] [Segatella oris]